jgi:LPXTG-motif cell wall-anchored protein
MDSRLDIELALSLEASPMKILAIVLIVLGAISLAYGGISYTRKEKVIDIGPIQATRTRHETIPLPPLLGGLALVGGIALLFVRKKG